MDVPQRLGRPLAPTHVPTRSPLERLPHELLTSVADCLCSRALKSLARTSKSLQPVAEETLYRTIRLRPHCLCPDDPYLVLLRNLLVRKDLSDKVRHLKVEASDRMISMFSVSEDDQRFVLQALYLLPECVLAGSLLAILPALRSLKIVVTFSDDVRDSFEYMFRDEACRLRRAIYFAQNTAFRNLTRLDWTSTDLPEAVVCLPTLRHLSLDQSCVIPDVRFWTSVPSITSLHIARTISLFRGEIASTATL